MPMALRPGDDGDAGRERAHRAGDVVGQADDARRLDARRGLELVERDDRAGLGIDDLAAHAEVAAARPRATARIGCPARRCSTAGDRWPSARPAARDRRQLEALAGCVFVGFARAAFLRGAPATGLRFVLLVFVIPRRCRRPRPRQLRRRRGRRVGRDRAAARGAARCGSAPALGSAARDQPARERALSAQSSACTTASRARSRLRSSSSSSTERPRRHLVERRRCPAGAPAASRQANVITVSAGDDAEHHAIGERRRDVRTPASAVRSSASPTTPPRPVGSGQAGVVSASRPAKPAAITVPRIQTAEPQPLAVERTVGRHAASPTPRPAGSARSRRGRGSGSADRRRSRRGSRAGCGSAREVAWLSDGSCTDQVISAAAMTPDSAIRPRPGEFAQPPRQRLAHRDRQMADQGDDTVDRRHTQSSPSRLTQDFDQAMQRLRRWSHSSRDQRKADIARAGIELSSLLARQIAAGNHAHAGFAIEPGPWPPRRRREPRRRARRRSRRPAARSRSGCRGSGRRDRT